MLDRDRSKGREWKEVKKKEMGLGPFLSAEIVHVYTRGNDLPKSVVEAKRM